MLEPATRSSATPAGQIAQIHPRTDANPLIPVGLASDLTLGAIMRGQSDVMSVNVKTAVRAAAAQATNRQRALSIRPLGKSITMKRKTPVGNTRAMIQVESHAAHCSPG